MYTRVVRGRTILESELRGSREGFPSRCKPRHGCQEGAKTREGLEEGTASAKPWDRGELRHFKKQKSQCGKRASNKVRTVQKVTGKRCVC